MPVKGKPAASNPRPIPKSNTVVKSYTQKQCMSDAKTRLKWNNMGCGTDPDPANAFCYQTNHSAYQQQTKYCGKL